MFYFRTREKSDHMATVISSAMWANLTIFDLFTPLDAVTNVLQYDLRIYPKRKMWTFFFLVCLSELRRKDSSHLWGRLTCKLFETTSLVVCREKVASSKFLVPKSITFGQSLTLSPWHWWHWDSDKSALGPLNRGYISQTTYSKLRVKKIGLAIWERFF